ncbi:MAG: hypothetical protein KC414_15150 [Romboutsia sp.]|nr:hypothetical protein [Romboutsia sp.]
MKNIFLKSKHYLLYTLKKDLVLIGLAITLFIAACAVFSSLYIKEIEIGVWTNIIDPLVTLLTVSITIIVYLTNARKNWEDNLEKRLTVHFMYKDKYMMSCIQAFLTGTGDIRQWGQQIGRQMNGGKNLDFFPYMTLSDSIDDTYNYKDYILTVYLENINTLKSEIINNYIVWIDNNDKTAENIALNCGKHPDKSYSIEEAIQKHNNNNESTTTISKSEKNGTYIIQNKKP